MKKLLQPAYALSASALVLAVSLIVGVAVHISALNNGREITIDARGYDPRAVLLGHYVMLQPDLPIDLTLAEIEALTGAPEPNRPRRIQLEAWIVLERSDAGWQAASVLREQPNLESAENRVLLKAEIDSGWRRDRDTSPVTFQPDLGIDRFYTNQDEATRIEQQLRDGNTVQMILNVDEAGKASLKGISVGDDRSVVSWW